MRTRVLNTLLSACLAVAFVPCAAWAEADDASGEGSSQSISEQLAKGGTVTLGADATENVTVPAGVTATLDLNGHTLDGGTAAGKATIANEGDLTIINGMVKRDDAGAAGYYVVNNEGTLTLGKGVAVENDAESASVVCNGNASDATLSVQDGASVASRGESIAVKNDEHGILNMNGGMVESASKTNAAILNWNVATVSAGTVSASDAFAAFETKTAEGTPASMGTISGGTFDGKILSLRDQGNVASGATVLDPKIIISGGTFSGEVVARDGTAVQTNNKLMEISGGTFSMSVKNYVASGYTCVKTADAYTVERLSAETASVKAGDECFDSLAEAFEAATDGTTIQLLKDVEIDAIVPVSTGQHLTFDLAGHAMKSTANTAFNNASDSSLTIVDSSEKGTGSVEARAIANISGELTVNGGTFKGITSYGVMANSGAYVSINGGTFEAEKANSRYAVLYANKGAIVVKNAVVTNATEGSYVLRTGTTTGTLTVSDGQFKGALKADKTGSLSISGGMFTVDPTIYLVDGMSAQFISEGGYSSKVVPADELKTVEPETAVAPTQVEVAETIAPEAKEASEELAKALVSDTAEAPALKVDDKVLKDAAEAEALPVDQAIVINGEVTSPLAELQKVEGLSSVSAEDVAVVRQAFLQATVNDVQVGDSGVKEFTVDIQPMVKTFVTTKESIGNIEEGANAVALGEAQTINVEEPTTVTIPLVAAFTAEPESTLYVKHNHEGKIFFYHAKVEEKDGVRTASFNNPNGFSEFTISSTNSAVVEIGEGENAVGYESLDAAVANAENGAVIKVLDKAAVKGSKIILSEAKSFSLVDSKGNPYTDIVFAAGKGYMVADTPAGTFEAVQKVNLKGAEVTLAEGFAVYTGHAAKPEVTVSVNGQQLVEGTDYKVSYDNNTNAGQATLTVSGLGTYFGTVDKTFEIAKAAQSVSLDKTSYSVANGAKAFSLGLKGGKSGYQCATSNAKVATVSATGKVTVRGVGTATLEVRAAEGANYKASAYKSVTVKVSPKGIKLSKVKAAKKSFKASWKKSAKANADGYQIRYSTSKKMSKAKKVTVKSYKTASKVVKGLKGGKKYYVEVRVYKKDGKTTYNSAWSSAKKVTVRK